jgi:hypothetical protein
MKILDDTGIEEPAGETVLIQAKHAGVDGRTGKPVAACPAPSVRCRETADIRIRIVRVRAHGRSAPMGGSPGIGVFTRFTTRGRTAVARVCVYSPFIRRPRRGPGALAGPDAPLLSPSR